MPVTYEQLVAKANQHAKNLQVDEIEGIIQKIFKIISNKMIEKF